MKPRLLDLFCGAGGASMGYYRARREDAREDARADAKYKDRDKY